MKYFKIISLVFAAMILQACDNDRSWNQKITIVVETPDGIKTGSAVTRVVWEENFLIKTFFKDGSPSKYTVTGEAAFVDLGSNRYLFAVIGDGIHARLAENLIRADKSIPKAKKIDSIDKLPKPTIIPPDYYPLLVTFQDVTDPASVKELNTENFSDVFGGGYYLKDITFEIVDDAPSNKIENVLKWWKEYRYAINGTYSKRLNGKTGSMGASREVANLLGPSNFKIEDDK